MSLSIASPLVLEHITVRFVFHILLDKLKFHANLVYYPFILPLTTKKSSEVFMINM